MEQSHKKVSKKAWVVTFTVLLAGVALAFAQWKVAPLISVLVEHFNITLTTAGWLSSTFTICALVTSLPASFILSKLGFKKCGIIALTCAILGCCLGIVSANIEVLMVSRIIEGVGTGVISVIAPALVSMWFPAEKRGLPMGVWGSWQMIAQTITFLIASKITDVAGWKGIWYIGICLALIAFILYTIFAKAPRPEENYADVEEAEYKMIDGLKVPSVWFISLSTLFWNFAVVGFATWIASYWMQEFNWSADKANSFVSLIYALEIVMVIVIGWGLNHIKNRKLIAEWAHVLYAVVLFLCFRIHNPALVLPFCIIYAFAEGAIPTTFWTVMPQTVPKPELVGVAIGVFGTLQALGMLLAPPVIGFFIETFGWNLGSIPMVIGAVLGLVCFMFVEIYPAQGTVAEMREAKQKELN